MRKIIVVCSLLLVGIVCSHAQKISKFEENKFENYKYIETSYVKVNSGKMKSEGNMQFRLINDKDGLKVNLKWTTNTEDYSIPSGATLIFLDDKGNRHELTSVKEVFPKSGGGATGGFFGADILGLDIIYTGDLSFLGSCKVTDMRVNNNRDAVDVDISEKNAEKIAKLYQLVIEKLK